MNIVSKRRPAPDLPGAPRLDPGIAAQLCRDRDGLVAAVVRQHDTGEVLMLAWMDDQALHQTLTTGRATYWSRSRGRLWVKGETSGHYQDVRAVALDCDGDALLVSVDQVGPACHTGARSCFQTALPVAPERPVGPAPEGSVGPAQDGPVASAPDGATPPPRGGSGRETR